MFIVIENDGCTPEFLERVAYSFEMYCNFVMHNGKDVINVINCLPGYTNNILISDENSPFPVGYHEACRYHNQNKYSWENCIVLNYYLVNNEYWPRKMKPDLVFIVGGKDYKSERYKQIHKISNSFEMTRVIYITSDVFACSEEERLRMLSYKMFIAATNRGHVFREDLIASENV